MRMAAKWQDGKPVTARDVKFSYDRTLDPASLLDAFRASTGSAAPPGDADIGLGGW